MSALGFGGRSEKRGGKFGGLEKTGGNLVAADGAARLVFLPTRSGDVAAGDALDRQGIGFSHDHRAVAEDFLERAKNRRERFEAGSEEVAGNEIQHAMPEGGHLRENLALARDAGGQDAVESGNAIRRHDEQGVAEVENLADFSAPELRDAR